MSKRHHEPRTIAVPNGNEAWLELGKEEEFDL